MKTLVRQLRPGDAFRVDMGKFKPLDYRLIYVNECRAYVEPLTKTRDILDENSQGGGRANITPNCECELIDEGLEIMMKSTTGAAATKTPAVRMQKNADRKFDPKKQTRAVREGTIRARLLAAIESGKNDIPKLMKEFGMARPLLVAHVHEFWKCHGYGYSVTGDVVKVVKPVGGVLKAEKAKANSAKPKSKKTSVNHDPLGDDEDPLA